MNGIRQFRSPLLGTGFFHRGGESGIYATGSHNFFLQMFLETGLPGGILMLLIFLRMWKVSGSEIARDSGFTVPVRSALTAAIIGGMSGEYYYGGAGLVVLFLVYAACGSLPVTGRRVRSPVFLTQEALPPAVPAA
jgi:O-antigen ligase